MLGEVQVGQINPSLPLKSPARKPEFPGDDIRSESVAISLEGALSPPSLLN